MSRITKNLLVVLAAVLWVGCSVNTIAQSRNAGDIRGVVTDPAGAAIPDVTVVVVNMDTRRHQEPRDQSGWPVRHLLDCSGNV